MAQPLAGRQAEASGARPFLLGGPATTALYENWVDSLLLYVAENNLRLDFFSWHRYDREIEVYEEDVRKIDEFIADHPQYGNIEFHITEWGHDPKNDEGYDGSYSAAQTVTVATELIGKIKRAFVFEIEDGKDPGGKEYWGVGGLLLTKSLLKQKHTQHFACLTALEINDFKW
jgi:hypothetical protein